MKSCRPIEKKSSPMESELSNMPSMRKKICITDLKWKIVLYFKYTGSFVHDCFLPNCPKSTVFGVFDGHGGREISSRLVLMLPNVILPPCRSSRIISKYRKG